MRDRVHPDAIAEQRAAGLAPRWVDRHDRDAQPVVLVEAKAADDLVGERALAGAAGSGDSEHRRRRLRSRGEQRVARLRGQRARLQRADDPRERPRARVALARRQHVERRRKVVREIDVARGDDLVDHPLQAEPLTVFRREDARDAVIVQLADLVGHDDAAAAAEHLHVRAAALAQQVDHVLEELDVAALIRRDGDAVRVLLQRAVDDLLDRAVVPEVDHLAAGRLQDAAHDVDRRVVAVEQARRRDEAHLVHRLVDERRAARVVHGEVTMFAGRHQPGTAYSFRPEVRCDTVLDVYVNVKYGCASRSPRRAAPGARKGGRSRLSRV